MRKVVLPFLTWLLIASGAFLITSGALDYWQSQKAQSDMAAEWASGQEPPSGSRNATALDTPNHSRDLSRQDGPVIPNATRVHFADPQRRPQQKPYRKGDAVARLSIPRLATVLYVVEGTDDGDLKRGPGHLEGSVLPGQGGNCIIAGHRDTHFSVLRNIRRGDEIVIDRGGSEFRYKVDDMAIVSPDNTDSLRPTSDAELHLITCFPFQYVGSAPKRFIVRAKLEA